MFSLRWLVQAYHSRRAGKPVTPTLFWIMSMVGSSMMLVYFIFSPKQDMVGVINNLFPGMVSAYNLYLEFKMRRLYNNEKKGPTMTAGTTMSPSLVPEQAAGE
jgi:lipid-A-disaccharide synthase-like uncharacterized protein